MDGTAIESDLAPISSGTKRRYSTMAESYASSATPRGRVSRDPHYNNEHRSQRPRLDVTIGPRFAGDGLDFRHPASTTHSAPAQSSSLFVGEEPETIDLTHETLALPRVAHASHYAAPSQEHPPRSTRLPRFSRDDIIDLSSSDDEEAPGSNILSAVHGRGQASTENSMAFQADSMDEEEHDRFFSDLMDSQAERTPRRAWQTRLPGDNVVDLTDDDVEFIESRSIASANTHEPTLSSNVQASQTESRSRLPFSVGTFANMFRSTTSPAQAHYRSNVPPSRLRSRIAGYYQAAQQAHETPAAQYPHRQFNGGLSAALGVMQTFLPAHMTNPILQVPAFLDYQTTAFDLEGSIPARRDRSPEYQPPPATAEGFTRNPGEDEVVVCPNCGDELAQGENEVKRQVWVLKACGHAYCGSCIDAKLRRTARGRSSKKDAPPELMADGTPLLKKCVIDGCGKNVTKSNAVHVYLSE